MDAALLSAIEGAINRYIKSIENTTIDGVLRKHIEGGMTSQQTLDRYTRARPSTGVSFALVKQEAVDFLSAYKDDLINRGGGYVWDAKEGKPKFVSWLKDQETSVRAGITSKVNEAIEQGWGSGKLAKSLESVWDETDTRNSAVARSELARAQWQGSHTRFKNSDIKFVRRLLGMNPCPICDAIATADVGYGPGVYRIDDVPEVPVHPNCISGDTRVETPGSIVAATRSKYSGPVITVVVANGRRLTITPNHMLLTRHGWIAAQFLRKGDDILYRPGFKGVVPGVHPYDDNMPPTAEEIFNALLMTGGMRATVMPAAPEYFHNDGKFIQGNIDIILPDRLLPGARNTAVNKHFAGDCFDGTDAGTGEFNSDSAVTQVLRRLAFASDRIVGGVRTTSPFFGGRASCIDDSLFAHCADSNPGANEVFSDRVAIDRVIFSECLERLSGTISSYEVCGVEIEAFHGYVYDFTTTSTLLLCNGSVISNCMCDDMPVLEDEM